MFKKIIREISLETCTDKRVVEAVVRHPFKILRDKIKDMDNYDVFMFHYFGKFIPFKDKRVKNLNIIKLKPYNPGNVAIIRIVKDIRFPINIYLMGDKYEIDSFKVKVQMSYELKNKYKDDPESFFKDVMKKTDKNLIRSISI